MRPFTGTFATVLRSGFCEVQFGFFFGFFCCVCMIGCFTTHTHNPSAQHPPSPLLFFSTQRLRSHPNFEFLLSAHSPSVSVSLTQHQHQHHTMFGGGSFGGDAGNQFAGGGFMPRCVSCCVAFVSLSTSAHAHPLHNNNTPVLMQPSQRRGVWRRWRLRRWQGTHSTGHSVHSVLRPGGLVSAPPTPSVVSHASESKLGHCSETPPLLMCPFPAVLCPRCLSPCAEEQRAQSEDAHDQAAGTGEGWWHNSYRSKVCCLVVSSATRCCGLLLSWHFKQLGGWCRPFCLRLRPLRVSPHLCPLTSSPHYTNNRALPTTRAMTPPWWMGQSWHRCARSHNTSCSGKRVGG